MSAIEILRDRIIHMDEDMDELHNVIQVYKDRVKESEESLGRFMKLRQNIIEAISKLEETEL